MSFELVEPIHSGPPDFDCPFQESLAKDACYPTSLALECGYFTSRA